MQFVLRYTKGGGSSTKSFINNLKSKHRIHVIHESEATKTILAQEEIQSQIVKKEMSLFEATKKRSNNLEKQCHALIIIKLTLISGTRVGFFNHGTNCHKLISTLNDESVL